MNAASPADILRAVEWWARVRGFTVNGRPWGFAATLSAVHVAHYGSDDRFDTAWVVPPAIALAWALLVETGFEPVDVGRCPACRGRGIWCVWHRGLPDPDLGAVQASGDAWRHLGWETFIKVERAASFLYYRLLRVKGEDCPACDGTGRETIPAERLLLNAVSGDATARDRLLVRADELQAAANPLGDLLAWALRLWAEEPTVDAGPCEPCKGSGGVYKMEPLLGCVMSFGCLDCGGADSRSGTGRLLGHPHTAEAVRWSEWLTWGNWFAERHRERGRVVTILSSDYPRTAIDWNDSPAHDGMLGVRVDGDNQQPITVYGGSLLPEPTFGGTGEVISVTAGEHTYAVTTERPMTAGEIAAAFNEQGGPATFVSADDGRVMSMGFHEASSASHIIAELQEPPAFIPEPETLRHQPHARHIGARLGRRLGVRR